MTEPTLTHGPHDHARRASEIVPGMRVRLPGPYCPARRVASVVGMLAPAVTGPALTIYLDDEHPRNRGTVYTLTPGTLLAVANEGARP